MSILLLLFIVFIGGVLYLLWPLIRLFLEFGRSTRSARQAFRQAQQRAASDPRNRSRRHRKIIDPSVGEYVEFEEINTYSSSQDGSSQESSSHYSYKVEQQVEDAEWEDIK